MRFVRASAVAVAAVLVAGGCTGDDGGAASTTTGPGSSESTTPPVTVPLDGSGEVSGDGLDGVVLARALVPGADLPGYEVRSFARPYEPDERPGLLVCGVDLRAEEGLLDGVQSVLVSGAVQVTTTVSAAADSEAATGFVQRFGDVAGGCAAPWTQEAPLLGVGPIEAEVVGPADVGSPGPQVLAHRLRTTTDAGVSDVIVAVMAVGPLVVTVTVAGPAGDELSVATDAVAAAARRSLELVAQLG